MQRAEQRRAAKKRGAQANTPNRFESTRVEQELVDFEYLPEDVSGEQSIATQVLFDKTQSILTRNDSPDISFTYSVNPYRGCEHGCVYCYARPTHETLGMSAGLEFETKIMVKQDAANLLEKELRKKSWQPEAITFSGVTDCYQPLERRFGITRSCLEVLFRYRNPAAIITKSALVLRDIDLLATMAEKKLIHVCVTVTSLDERLAQSLEPRAALPKARLEVIRRLSAAGVPVCVMIAPLIPGLTDEEIPGLLEAARANGAISAGYTLLRLPMAVETVFLDWLDHERHEKAQRIRSLIKGARGGKMNSSEWGMRMRGSGEYALQVARMFKVFAKRYELDRRLPELDVAGFTSTPEARPLFDE